MKPCDFCCAWLGIYVPAPGRIRVHNGNTTEKEKLKMGIEGFTDMQLKTKI